MTKNNNYLAHYGVKGQKWGSDGIRMKTEASQRQEKKKYQQSIDTLKSKLEEEKKAASQALQNSKTTETEAKAKARLKVERAREAVSNAEIRAKLAVEKNRGKHRQKLEEHYKKQGLSQKDAEVEAYKRERAEKMLAVAGVVSIAALTAYGIKKHRASVDFTIPKDTTLQHITLNPNKGVTDAFYASFTKGDKKKYLGMYGGYQLQTRGKHDVHVLTTKAAQGLNIAGEKSGRKIVQELIRGDPEYAKWLREATTHKYLTSNLKMPGLRNVQKATLGKAELTEKGYRAINTALNDESVSGKAAAERFYQKLREKGYNGLLDTNDVWTSGYNAKKPVIIVGGKSVLADQKMSTLSSKTVRKKSLKYLAIIGGVPMAKFAAKSYVQNKVQGSAKRTIKNRIAERKLISDYKKKHPNTKLSNNQILEVQLRR